MFRSVQKMRRAICLVIVVLMVASMAFAGISALF